LIEEGSVHLEAGAIGYELLPVGPLFRDSVECKSPDTFTSGYDYARVTVTSGSCMEVRISTRKYSWSWWAEKGHVHDLCPGQFVDHGKSGTNSVKAEMCQGAGTYTLSFHN
jgi:hypothetical protein